MTNTPHFISPTYESVSRFLELGWDGPVVMLNLLRFRAVADYSQTPELAPAEPISGEEAYKTYVKLAEPFINEVGSRLLMKGKGAPFLIGPDPDDEHWDLVLLVEHPSATAFLAFAQNEHYLAIVGHRSAALADSRLLPFFDE